MQNKKIRLLAIESSCDETAASVVVDGREVLSSVVASQIEIHKLYGGVVPEIASRKHTEVIVEVVQKALDDANIMLKELDGIAVTYAPGLIGALLVGVNFAKGLALSTGLPLIPVHHIKGHIAANYIAFKELTPPFLCLVVSGGHSHIIEVNGYTSFKVLGRTRDDAVGECYDKAARVLGFPYPGGVYLDKAAKDGNEKAFKFPRASVDGSPYDFSFSGLKTAVVNCVHKINQKGEPLPVSDIAASFQQAAVDVLANNLLKAAQEYNFKKIVIAGGVAANSGLRERIKTECHQRGYELFLPPLNLCGDNAAMIGSQGYYEMQAGNFAGLDLNAVANMALENKGTVHLFDITSEI
jgi:N6-L-threonylcarbamoyladenine synthase